VNRKKEECNEKHKTSTENVVISVEQTKKNEALNPKFVDKIWGERRSQWVRNLLIKCAN